ncbi:MAG: excinuclease ABC subunit UvrC [Holosporales bacterium]|jgi:excinuclease ABC subunit C|nr:excinuclease ABC subunit UvrC [Holosporales bacterium]
MTLLSQEFAFEGYSDFQRNLQVFPDQPGVYRFLSREREILYIGKAKNLRKRLQSYAKFETLALRLQRLVTLLAWVGVTTTQTETEALLLEASLIREYKPRFNILLKDDKSFPSLLLSAHPFPQLVKYRGCPPQPGLSFGPFLASSSVEGMVEEIARAFKIRTCSDVFFSNRHRPCLRFDIQRCTAPCTRPIAPESYQEQVQAVVELLEGKSHALQRQLARKMQAASAQLRYEDAARYRDQIRALTKILAHQEVYYTGLGDSDVVVFAHHASTLGLFITSYRQDCFKGERAYFVEEKGESLSSDDLLPLLVNLYKGSSIPRQLLLHDFPKSAAQTLAAALSDFAQETVCVTLPQRGKKAHILQQALERARTVFKEREGGAERFAPRLFSLLAETFALPQTPECIEVYDNSHHRGQFPYGVKIVATSQGFQPKRYRRFPLSAHGISTQDDYAMLQETLALRFRQEAKDPLPDLLLIDGGKGQLSAVQQALEAFSKRPEVLAIAKGPERHAGKERFFWGKGQERESTQLEPDLLFFLQRLRDEAHRFAITAHRRAHRSSLRHSSLEDIPGVGPRRKQILLRYFGSIKGLQAASLEDLARLPGFSRKQAQEILDFVRP